MSTFCRHAILVLGAVTLAWWAPAQGPITQIDLNPASPGINDTVTFKLSGVWRDGCVPESPTVSVSGFSVQIETVNPDDHESDTGREQWTGNISRNIICEMFIWITDTGIHPGLEFHQLGKMPEEGSAAG